MNAPSNSTSKIGAGRSIVNRHDRTYLRGSLMFIEGESSSEMFIIRSGKIRILKQEGESTVELAILGAGSVLGELSLLDHQPRGATAQVIEDVTVTIIDQDLFARTMEKIPSWLSNIVQIVVKRLRDTMKRTSDDVVKKSVSGVIRILLLLMQSECDKKSEEKKISLIRVKEALYKCIGLGGVEAENVFLHLILKDMVYIRKNDIGQEFVFLHNPEILQIYMNYLRAKQTNTPFPGEQLTDQVFELIDQIRSAGEQVGRRENDRLIKVGVPQIELIMEKSGKGRFVNLDALDKLIEAKLIVSQRDVTESTHGTHKRSILVYNDEALRKISLLRVWLSVFKEDVFF